MVRAVGMGGHRAAECTVLGPIALVTGDVRERRRTVCAQLSADSRSNRRRLLCIEAIAAETGADFVF